MRDRYEIKTEIDAVQEDLENNIAQLRDVITEKVDIKAKVHDRVEAKKDQAMDAVVRVRQRALDLFGQARNFVREKPLVVAGIAGGVLLVGGAVFAIRGKLRASEVGRRFGRRYGTEIHNFDDLILALEDLRRR